MENDYLSTTDTNKDVSTSFSNCHRTSSKKNVTSSATISETDSDQDSANSKYVVKNDDRERRDGPGGN